MVKPLKGIVVSNKMMKSVTVMVERIYKHPRWGKYVRGRKKYMGASEAPRGIPKQTPLAIARSNAPPPGPVVSVPPARAPLLCASPRALTCDPPRTQRTTSTTRAASGTESRWCTVAP